MNRLKHVLLHRHSLILQLILALSLFLYASTGIKPVLAQSVYPGSSWATASPADMGMDETKLNQAVSYARGSGYIIRSGRVVKAWGSASTLYDLRSTTKSVASIATALAIADGRLDLSDFADQRHPSFGVPPQSNRSTGWLSRITLKHLATQTAGFAKNGGYTQVLYSPGSEWFYSDGGPNWLAEITTLAFGQDLRTVLFNRVFTPIGISGSQLTWRSNMYRNDTINGIKNREYGSGMKATVNAMARIGYLYLRDGRWNSHQLVPADYIAQARVPQSEGLPEHNPSIAYNASDHYGLLWWNNGDGTLANVPTDAYWAWGLNDSVIVVIPSLDIVAVRAGTSSEAWQSGWEPDYSVMRPFLEPIVQSTGIGSKIEILAAPKGTPTMQLRIDDLVVATFSNIAGNYSSRTFTNYTYWSLEPVAIEQIKVAFVNDSSSNDLYIDKIILDGAVYESEAPATYSTGVYTSGKCQFEGGYFQSERLACNGYFQYDRVEGTSPDSIIEPDTQTAETFMLLSPPNGATSLIETPTFVWSADTNAVCYLIEIDDNNDFSSPVQQATVVRSTQYPSTALASGLYYWRVQTGGNCSDAEPGPWSEVWTLTVNAQ